MLYVIARIRAKRYQANQLSGETTAVHQKEALLVNFLNIGREQSCGSPVTVKKYDRKIVV